MGFALRCVIATAESPDEAAALVSGLCAAIPHTRGRAFERPFRGVIVGAYYDDLVADFHRHSSAIEAEDESEIEWLVPEHLPDASRRFPGKRFAYIDVDCFGGTCLYDGEIVVDGETVFELDECQQDGHLRLLAELGVEGLDWHFPPFEREYLDGAEAAAELRRPIRGVVEGRIAGMGLDRLAPILFVALQGDWVVRVMGETILLTASDDDLALSINPGSEQHELGGRSHVEHELAARHLEPLVEALADFDLSFEVTLSEFAGREPVRRWSARADESAS